MAVLSYASHDFILAAWRDASPKLALLTAAPNPDGTGIAEAASGHGYARQDVGLTDFTRLSGVSTTSNDAALVFGPATTADWSSVTHAALFSSAGDLLAYGPLPAAKVCVVGDSLSFGIGSVQWRFK